MNIKNSKSMEIITKSIVTCPICGHKKEEPMPTHAYACQYFYECENCKTVLKSKQVCQSVKNLL